MATTKTKRGDAKLIRRIRKLAEPWAAFLGLSQRWEIEFQLADFPVEAEEAGQIFTRYPYQKALIKLNRAWAAKCSDFELETLVVHELGHIIVETANGPLKDMVGEHSEVGERMLDRFEALVDEMTRVFMRLRTSKNGGVRYGSV